VQDLAREWVRLKEAEQAQKPAEMVTLEPNFHGVAVDLKEAGRRLFKWVERRLSRGLELDQLEDDIAVAFARAGQGAGTEHLGHIRARPPLSFGAS
jgi:hypothetical protein